MSLLINESYANPSTPLWVPTSGNSTIDGNVTLDGNLTVNGTSVVNGNFSADAVYGDIVSAMDPAGNTILRMAADSGNGLLQSPTAILFTKVNVPTGNTSLTLSIAGSGLDLFQTNFLRAVGPIPDSVAVTNPTTITLNAPPTTLTLTPAYTLVANAEYDIQCTGYWSVPVGVVTPATLDYAQVRVEIGTGISPGFYDKIIEINTYPAFPENPWTSGSPQPFQARARVKGANLPTLTVTASFNGTGTYPGGVVDLFITTLDIVRVA